MSAFVASKFLEILFKSILKRFIIQTSSAWDVRSVNVSRMQSIHKASNLNYVCFLKSILLLTLNHMLMVVIGWSWFWEPQPYGIASNEVWNTSCFYFVKVYFFMALRIVLFLRLKQLLTGMWWGKLLIMNLMIELSCIFCTFYWLSSPKVSYSEAPFLTCEVPAKLHTFCG